MIDFENIYNEYIKKENAKHKENYVGYEDWFSASSAGSCLKRQYYKHIKTEPTDLPNAQSLRKMRFGTILHKDVENAINWYKEHHKEELEKDNMEIVTEYKVKIPDLKVVGHLDFAIKNNEKAEIYDLKSAHEYTYKLYAKKLGKTSDNRSYNMQVSTYGLAFSLEHDLEDFKCYLLWYNKNDSRMNTKEIPIQYADNALFYWTDVNEIIETITEPNQLKRGVDDGVPFEKWQCGFCEFSSICK
tara:strand:- start:547 stop:1278 length:732 start_codon:yes stop_codon:yes gene_type:complete